MATSLLDCVGAIPLNGSRIEYKKEYLATPTSAYATADDCDCHGGDCSDCVCTDCNECGNDD